MSESSASIRGDGDLPRVAVIGGGVIGLGIGWKLARAGCPVTVFDRGEAGRGASWAAGGMLCAGVEAEPGEEALWQLAAASQRLWPDFRYALKADSGLDLGYREDGTMVIALTRDDLEQLRFNYEFQRSIGVELEWLSGAEARRREPYLNTGTAAAYYCKNDHQVDNRALVTALKPALLKAGGTLREQCEVTGVEISGDRVTGIRTGDTVHSADVVVMAAGAWSRGIEGLPESVRPPVRPIRGQLLYLRMNPTEPLVRHVIWAPKAYLIPRKDGRLLIGATTEERGFDARPTAGGVFSLLEGAWRAMPGIEELVLDEIVVGFRPGTRDDAPILGPTAIDGLLMATGHHRNGILLAPITVEAIVRYVLNGKLLDPIRPYGVDRFRKVAEVVA
ncbi:MAG: glycine oxidase ThiO [Rhodospirillaceae bacterium]